VLRKIYGPVYDNGIWRIRTNKELMVLYQELNIVAEIKKARLRWLGHVEGVFAGPKCDGLMTWRKILER
jgi:hypothetical protein